jgi:hypothetical protein
VFTAVVRVSGAGRLADFRERLRWLMVRDADAEDYTEHHAEGVLEYRFTPRKGIPFPAFAEASREFPELRVEAQWQHGGERGHATIENGALVEQAGDDTADFDLHVEAGEDGRLLLGIACRKAADAWIGYAATCDRHTFFRYRAGALELLDAENADAALEELALAFAEQWLWYDEEEAPLERSRYAGYGYPVRGANLRAEKLAQLRRSAQRHSTLGAEALAARAALLSQWLKPA